MRFYEIGIHEFQLVRPSFALHILSIHSNAGLGPRLPMNLDSQACPSGNGFYVDWRPLLLFTLSEMPSFQMRVFSQEGLAPFSTGRA